MEINFELWDDNKLFVEMFKATGRSTRLVDELIQEFFEKPIGTKIPVYDHYGDRKADEFLLEMVLKRLDFEHPSASYKVHKGEHITIERTSRTYHEEVKEEYKRRQEEKI